MKIITVGNGFVASHLPYEIVNNRLSDVKSMDRLIDEHKPDIIINAIGFCGNPNVDQCESEKYNTVYTNTIIPIELANVCKDHNVRMIHIGSGCIFYGKSPNVLGIGTTQYSIAIDHGWNESDFANPESYYSKSKYAADLAISSLDNVSILRIRMPISSNPSPRNLISKLLKYSHVIDEKNSMTYMDDFVRCVDHVINKELTGIYNVSNSPGISPADIMLEYQKYVKDHKFDVIDPLELEKQLIAKRSNCILDNSKLISTGFEMTNSDAVIKDSVKNYILKVMNGK